MKSLFASLVLLLALLACTKTTPTPVVVAVTPQPTGTASVTPAPTRPVQTSAPHYVTVRGDWYCREAASVGADVIGYVSDGDVVEIVQVSGGWTQVRVANGIEPCWLAGW